MATNFATKTGTLLLGLLMVSLQLPAFCQHNKGVSNSLVVNAKPQVVFKAIQKARSASGARKLISYKNNQAIIEELFDGLPLIGSAKCTYQEFEASPTRIDYSMIESDKLSKFEGSWILQQQEDGKTSVTLTSTTECGIKLPFADKLTTQSAVRRVERRLHEIAAAAEAEQKVASVVEEHCLVAARK